METIKKYLKSAGAILLLALSATVYYLITRLNSYKSKYGQLKADQAIREVLIKKEEAKKEADNAEDDYKHTRDEYLSNDEPEDGSGKA